MCCRLQELYEQNDVQNEQEEKEVNSNKTANNKGIFTYLFYVFLVLRIGSNIDFLSLRAISTGKLCHSKFHRVHASFEADQNIVLFSCLHLKLFNLQCK